MRLISLSLSLSLLPSAALACGGLFCNAVQPVNQSAERILFAKQGDTIHMHVQIAYQGPPTEFGWLLPAPVGVEVALSSEALFAQLDRGFAPIFTVITERVGCDDQAAPGAADGGATAFAGENDGARGVEVVSREAIGPFDRVILAADEIAPLRAWLDENDFAVPNDVDEKLEPYIEQGYVFVAIKLLPGSDSGDIQPLHLSFRSDKPQIPIRPTAVAAEPDMGILVHVLGDARAIPLNYKHVVINEAAIDWLGGGQNYPDVVSQAADEAGGKAFATDYAGIHRPNLNLRPIADDVIARVRAAAGCGEVLDALQELISFGNPDADVARTVQDCLQGRPDAEGFDAAAIADRIEQEINPARVHLTELLDTFPYLTRLYTTLSPAEMDGDPIFSFNPDLDPVDNQRQAVQTIDCVADMTLITTPSGLVFRVDQPEANDLIIRREGGATVAGQGTIGAMRIELMAEEGAPEVVRDRQEEVADSLPGGGGAADGGCLCTATGGSGSPMAALLLLTGLLATRRRRR